MAAYAADLRRNHPEVKRIVWFGSWVSGIPRAGSDVDLCLVLTRSDKPFRERIPDYLPGAFPVGLDLFPYTEAELERLLAGSPGWREALMRGHEL